MKVRIRASSWGALFDCAYRWQAEHILGMKKPSSLRAHIGTAIHHGTAVFDQARLDGKPIRPLDAADHYIDALHHPADEVDTVRDRTLTMNDAETIGLALVTKYCTEIAPRFRYKSVEMKLAPMEIECGDGVTIELTGTMDRARVADTAGGVIIPDVKTSGRIISNGEVTLKGKAAQIGVYQLMYENATGEATAGGQIIGLQTSRSAEVGVSRVFDARPVLLGPPGEPGLIEMAARMLKNDFFPPNPQSSLCSPKFCVRWDSCSFHD